MTEKYNLHEMLKEIEAEKKEDIQSGQKKNKKISQQEILKMLKNRKKGK